MSDFSLSSPFHLVAEYCMSQEERLRKVWGKVLSLLGRYAHSTRASELEDLTVLDIVGVDGELHVDLERFLTSIYPVKSTRQSQGSNVRRVARVALEVVLGRKLVGESAIMEADLPEYMRPAWRALPRAGWRSLRRDATADERARLPLTPSGEVVFRAMLVVHHAHKLSSLEELLIQHHREVRQRINRSLPPSRRSAVDSLLCDLRKALDLKIPRGKPALRMEELNPRLRGEVEEFIKLARVGLGAVPHLANLVVHYLPQVRVGKGHRKLEPLEENTISTYVSHLLVGLAYIDLPEDAGIEDLLKISPTVRHINGRAVPDVHNPYVDQYRYAQAAEETDFKGAGFDKQLFANFLNGLRAVGVFNGYFELIEPFNKAYRHRVDRRRRKARKSKKRKLMTRPWLHDNITRLYDNFKRVVRTGSFKHEPEDLRLCLFLAQLVVLRYLGFRQQCLRNCRRGIHVIIVPNKSVTFKWEAGEIKNEVAIDTTISLAKHGNVPELVLLLDVLTKYHTRVLPYLPDLFRVRYGDGYRAVYEKKVGDSFFLYFDKTDGTVSRFLADLHGHDLSGRRAFYQHFKSAAYALMDFSSLQSADVGFHPHFLRGVCCDWMRYDLGMSWEEIAQVLGDTEWTVRSEYFEELRTKSGTKPFARVSDQRAGERRQDADKEAVRAAGERIDKVVTAMGNQVNVLTDQCEYLRGLHEKACERIEIVESEVRAKEERIASLLAENAELRSLLESAHVAVV